MREICFRRTTEFSVTSTAIHHSPARSTAKLELTFASSSLRLTFHDPAALFVLVSAMNQLAFDADSPKEDPSSILARVYNRQNPLGSPDPAEPAALDAI